MVGIKISFDKFGRFETPTLTLCNPDCVATYNGDEIELSNPIGTIASPSDFSGELNFNAYSEFSFTATRDNLDEEVFQKITTYRTVYIEGMGFFVIVDCTKTRDGNEKVVSKSVQVQSCDIEIYRDEAPYVEDGLYSFTQMQALLASSKWDFTNMWVDPNLLPKERYFAEIDYDNLYEFLIDCLQEKYDCIFEFDTTFRTVKVFDKANYAEEHRTDVHLADYNLIEKFERSSSAEDTYTALKCLGGNDLDIAPVNPIGTNIIYDFTYRLDWMSSDLQNKVLRWKAKVDSVQEDYQDLAETLASDMGLQTSREGEVKEWQEKVDAAELMLRNYKADPQTPSDLITRQSGVVAEYKMYLQTAKNSLAEAQAAVARDQAAMISISSTCGLNTDATDSNGDYIFTSSDIETLASYINTGEYTNEDITVTDAMSYPEKTQQALALMTSGIEQLQKVSTENYKFTVETDGLVFNKYFSEFSQQLEPGCIVTAETDDDVFEEFHVMTISVDFSEQTADLVFSNKYNKYDPQSLFDDVLGSVQKSSSTLQRIVRILEDQKSKIKENADWIKNALTLTASHALSSKDQNIIISDSGLLGRQFQIDTDPASPTYGQIKRNGDDPLFEPEQLRLFNNGVYITKDGWQTVSAAIGKLQIGTDARGNPIYEYGVIGETIIGRILIGEQLYIEAQKSNGTTTTTVDGDGITVYGGNISVYGGTKSSPGSKLFGTDGNGNLVLQGKIYASGGEIAGWTINPNKIYGGGANGIRTAVIQLPTADSDTSMTYVFAAGGNSHSGYGDCPFRVSKQGTLYTENIQALGGTIGGFTISSESGSGHIYQTSLYIQSTEGSNTYEAGIKGSSNPGDLVFYVAKKTGQTWSDRETLFYVNNRGKLYAKNAEIEGTITANSGTIGGCTISNGMLNISNANIGTLTVGNSNISGMNVSKLQAGTNTNALQFNNILARGGNVGGWDISSTCIYNIDLVEVEYDWLRTEMSPVALTVREYQSASSTAEHNSYISDWRAIAQAGINVGNNRSDSRLKNSIEELPLQYEAIFDALQPKRYKYSDGTSGRYHTGFIAQDIVRAIEDANLTTRDLAAVCLEGQSEETGYWWLRRDELVALNTWQIQKLKARVAELETQVQMLLQNNN